MLESALKPNPKEAPAGKTPGFANLVPYPPEDQGYALVYGLPLDAVTTAKLSGGYLTLFDKDEATGDGAEYAVPNPLGDQG
jgi:hypothetical protein